MRFRPSTGARFALAAASGALLFMSACSPSASPDPSQSPVGPESSAVTVQPTPSPSATPAIPPSASAAITTVRSYVAVIDKLGSDSKANTDLLSTVARATALNDQLQLILDQRAAGHRQTGTTKVDLISPKAGSSDQQWVVSVCLDVSGVDVVDRNGKSVVAKNRPDRVRDVLAVDQDTASSKWFVTKDEVKGTC